MSFLTPVFISVGLLAAPIIVLYMLKLRRRELPVSSTMLWQRLLRDRQANAPWQRLRRNLLLFLQLLILSALALALARPFVPTRSLVSGNVVVLLDGSASMQATDVEPSRFEAARTEVRSVIDDMSGNNLMTLIEVAQSPKVLASAVTDKEILRQALDGAMPGTGESDWPAAFALASGAAQGFRDARILVISDGGLPQNMPPLSAETIYVPIGQNGENVALSALATRDTDAGPQLFASIANEGSVDRQVLLSVKLDGTLFDSRRLNISARDTVDLTWQIPKTTAVIEARLAENQEDYLQLDDTAWAVNEGGVSSRTLLLTEGNLFLERVYSVLPGIDLFKSSASGELLQDGEEAFDLYVFDGVELPATLPATDMLIIDPQPDDTASNGVDQLLSVTGNFSDTVPLRLADSPLLQYVDWRNVHVRQAKRISAPWAQPLVTAEGGPLILAGERSGKRVVIITFDLHDSDLPLQIAFPVLMANITDWLSPGRALESTTALRPGSPVVISPGLSASAVTVRKPDGTVSKIEVDQENVIFTETNQLGVYQVGMVEGSSERTAGNFAVNLFSPLEANISPVPELQTGQMVVTTASEASVGQREFWPLLLGTAFLVLLLEWWIQHRGAQLPGKLMR